LTEYARRGRFLRMSAARAGIVAALVATFAPGTAGADELPRPAPPPVDAPNAAAEHPLAGYYNGLFYLRDRADAFRLYVQGRVHVDALGWVGPGVGSLGADSALKSTLYLRRARAEIGGEFFEQWQWQLSGDFAPTATDNPAARNATRTCSVSATGAQTCSDVSSPVDPAAVRPIPTDAFVNFAPSPWLNVQVGQFLLPFTMENPVSDNTTPFLERSIVARGIGAPLLRDIGAMVWGEAPNRRAYYTIGLYNGDGPNRQNADSRFDVVARTFVRLDTRETSLTHDAQIGFSARYGSRDPAQVGYDQPSITTQGGYAFWRATYKDSLNRTMHIIPTSEQGAIGADVYVPIDGFDVTSELVYAHTNTREAIDGYQLTPFTERLGTLKGYAYYVQLGAWLIGSRAIVGSPSYGRPKHLDFAAPRVQPQRGLQALVKLEQLHLTYGGAARGGVSDPKTPNGDIDMTSISLGMNYWATRHLRVGVNYVSYFFPGSAPVAPSAPGGAVQTSNQRAVAPAQALAPGADDGARDGGHTLYEIQARVGVQF
jgi:hypothetical protein